MNFLKGTTNITPIIKTIGIYGQTYLSDYQNDLKTLFYKLKAKGLHILIESGFKSEFPSTISRDYDSFEEANLNVIDCLFAIGGDGTILKSLTLIKDSQLPVVGINFGRLGFLATVQRDNIDVLIEALVNRRFIIDQRSLLEIVHPTAEELGTIPYALNDICVLKKDSTSMITIDTSIDNNFLSSYWADGLAISTPTGSTGYSLSCGGPIMYPLSENFLITPVSPHNLATRPLAIPDYMEISLKVFGRSKEHIISLDSRMISLKNGIPITIKKASFYFPLIRLQKDDFLHTLRKKLLWGEDKRN